MITSTGNQQIKNVIQLQKKPKTRNQQRVFVVEGPRMALEAPGDWIEKLYVSESFWTHAKENRADVAGRELWSCLSGHVCEVVSDSVMKSISETMTPQGILCLVKMPEYTMEDLLLRTSGPPMLLVLENIQDPGNLGTMLRTGEGAGISGVIMNRTTVDLFNPKVVRSTMGSLYRVPFLVEEDLPGMILGLKARGIRFYAAHLEGNQSYTEPNYRQGCGFLIGNEGKGLSPAMASLADQRIRIPMEGQVESLNAAVAAALLMYEGKRQRG